MTARAPIALSMGDPAGIGPEITILAYEALRSSGRPFYIRANLSVLQNAAKGLGRPDGLFKEIANPSEASTVWADHLPVIPLAMPYDPAPGEGDARGAEAVIESIRACVRDVQRGPAGAIVTNPIHKHILMSAGFQFPGHTEFLADLTKTDDGAPLPVMMLAGPELRVALATIHLPLRQAVDAISVESLLKIGRIVASAMKTDFGIANPRIAVAGLNPHAGENGALGAEDGDVIAPAIAALQKEGIEARGPVPGDTMFHPEARETYDAAIAMYHDQGLIPVKTLSFHDAVNVTLGLPIVRASPDHGVAFDIAGRGVARADSLIAAIKLAHEMSARRAASC